MNQDMYVRDTLTHPAKGLSPSAHPFRRSLLEEERAPRFELGGEHGVRPLERPAPALLDTTGEGQRCEGHSAEIYGGKVGGG